VHIPRLFAATLVLSGAMTGAPAQAATIALASPMTGSTAAGRFVDLTVTFDPNAQAATNITGWELYVGFSGLSPVDASFALGSLFRPFEADVVEMHGTCADGAPCSPPADPAASGQWVSLASVFPPNRPQGPGTLFTLRLAVDPQGPEWSLTAFGEAAAPTAPCGSSSALLWEHPTDGPCAIVPFAIVLANDTVAAGTAKVGLAAIPTGSVPEPPVVALVAAGLALWRARHRHA
jgi:hypothetical protein